MFARLALVRSSAVRLLCMRRPQEQVDSGWTATGFTGAGLCNGVIATSLLVTTACTDNRGVRPAHACAMPDHLDFVRRAADNGRMETEAANTQEKKGRSSMGCLVAPLILVGVAGLFVLAYKFGRPEAEGSVAIERGRVDPGLWT